MKTKICTKCKIGKELINFYTDKRASDSLSCHCNKCQNQATMKSRMKNFEKYTEYNKRYRELNKEQKKQYYKINKKKWRISSLLRKFNLTLNEYNKLLNKQNGVCAICQQKETKKINNKNYMLSVDHCHIRNKVRGLLCNNCNRVIGLLKDNINILRSAVKYLTHAN